MHLGESADANKMVQGMKQGPVYPCGTPLRMPYGIRPVNLPWTDELLIGGANHNRISWNR